VEANAGAVNAALSAARAQRLCFAAAAAGDAAAGALAWVNAGLSVDVVVADPPRAGLGSARLAVTRLARRNVVLCSCNPRSLVRDVAALVAEGFRVESVTLFEMFPQTPHLESVVWLERVRQSA
jgi:tRNA/tmRNA/rRNA uracil-C5-methylase (TrmA/RlmC/RlmD family)